MTAEWCEHSFAELIQTKALEIGDGYRAKNSELGGDGPIFLRAGHVRDTHIDLEGVERFQSHLANAVASKMCQPLDVIVTTKGNSTGRTSYVSEDLLPFVYVPPSGIASRALTTRFKIAASICRIAVRLLLRGLFLYPRVGRDRSDTATKAAH